MFKFCYLLFIGIILLKEAKIIQKKYIYILNSLHIIFSVKKSRLKDDIKKALLKNFFLYNNFSKIQLSVKKVILQIFNAFMHISTYIRM